MLVHSRSSDDRWFFCALNEMRFSDVKLIEFSTAITASVDRSAKSASSSNTFTDWLPVRCWDISPLFRICDSIEKLSGITE